MIEKFAIVHGTRLKRIARSESLEQLNDSSVPFESEVRSRGQHRTQANFGIGTLGIFRSWAVEPIVCIDLGLEGLREREGRSAYSIGWHLIAPGGPACSPQSRAALPFCPEASSAPASGRRNRQSDQSRKGLRPRLLHDGSAVIVDGALADAEIGGDVLARITRQHEIHDLTLARR